MSRDAFRLQTDPVVFVRGILGAVFVSLLMVLYQAPEISAGSAIDLMCGRPVRIGMVYPLVI